MNMRRAGMHKKTASAIYNNCTYVMHMGDRSKIKIKNKRTCRDQKKALSERYACARAAQEAAAVLSYAVRRIAIAAGGQL